jgi:hypothetical protein
MALVLADRVLETTAVTGTGNAALAGAQANYQAFSVVGDGSTTYYTIVDNTNNEWEVGIGTYEATGNYISRDTVLSSSNAGALVYFGSGTKDIFCDLPAEKVATLGALSYQGTWNASTNVPTLASGVGTQGYYYVVSVAGSTNLDGITDWKVNDYAIYNGTAWQKIDNTDAVTSVNGQTGVVVLTASDVGAQPAGTYVTSVSATSPVTSSGGTTPTIAMPAATTSVSGYLTSADWTTFNGKQDAFGSQTANYVYAAPNGSAGAPTFRALVGADIPSLSSTYIPYTGASSAINLNAQTVVNVDHLGIGTTSVPTILVRAIGDNNSNSRIAVRGYSSNANSSSMRVTKFRGTAGAPQAPQSGDSLGKFELAGYGTTSSDGYPQASFEGVATQSWGAIARGAKTLIKVTPNNTITQVTAVTVDQDSKVTLAGALDVTGTTTLATSLSGLAKLTSGVVSAATSGTDYAPATSGTSILYGNGSGGFSNVTIGTGVSFAGGTLSATGSGGTVTSVSGTAPVVSSGGATPAISMAAATTSVNGYLTSTDWNTFNGKYSTGGALGTPSSGTLTNCTGYTYANLSGTVPTWNQDTTGKSAKTDALNSATTVVNVSSATAPSAGQVLTATSGTAATWQTPGGGFASGTAMLFVQTSAPTGWTKSTAHDNKALRIVSGTAGTGGSVAFTTAFASQAVTGSISVTVGAGTLAVGAGTFAVGATTLATTDIPSHTHGIPTKGTAGPYSAINGEGGAYNVATYNTNSTGGGGSHTHSLTGSPSISGSPSVTASSFTGNAINLAVQYVDVIIATKD